MLLVRICFHFPWSHGIYSCFDWCRCVFVVQKWDDPQSDVTQIWILNNIFQELTIPTLHYTPTHHPVCSYNLTNNLRNLNELQSQQSCLKKNCQFLLEWRLGKKPLKATMGISHQIWSHLLHCKREWRKLFQVKCT